VNRVSGRTGWLVLASVLVTAVFIGSLRVWLPSLLFVAGDLGAVPATLPGVVGLLVLAIAPVVVGSGRPTPRATWVGGVTLLVVGRLALSFVDGGGGQLAASTLAVLGGTLALAALAAGGPGHLGRLGVLGGVAFAGALHAGLGTVDLAWRSGTPGVLASAVWLGVTALVAMRATSEVGASDGEAAWPWLLLGPAVALLLVLVGPPGRVAVATDWPPAVVAAVTTLALGSSVIAYLAARRIAPRVAAATGGLAAVAGVAGALPASSWLAVASQVLLAIGIGLMLGIADPYGSPSTTQARRGAAGGGCWLLFGAITVGTYLGYDVALPVSSRSLLLASAIVLAVAAAAAARRQPVRVAAGMPTSPLRVPVAVLMIVALLAGAAGAGGPRPEAAPALTEAPLRVASLNLHLGFDPMGRFAAIDAARVLADEAVDIVVLNEVDRGWLVSGGHDVLRVIAEELELPYVFAPAADEVWGNALLSRFPVDELAVERLPRGADPMARSQLAAVLSITPDRQIAVVGTHLSAVDDQGDTRLPQARAVAATVARLRERGLPTLVMGTMNAELDSPEIGTFGTLVSSALPAGTVTFPSVDPVQHLDHVLVSPDVRTSQVAVPFVQVSDHLPVVATIEIVDG
jgi:endonuclease/exonuclease/phosphatase family metal-dependent hydrolase